MIWGSVVVVVVVDKSSDAVARSEMEEVPAVCCEVSGVKWDEFRVDDVLSASARAWAMGGVAGTVRSLPSRLDDAEDDGTASPLLVSVPSCDMRRMWAALD